MNHIPVLRERSQRPASRRLLSVFLILAWLTPAVHIGTVSHVYAQINADQFASQLHLLLPLYRYPEWWDSASYIWDDVAAAQQQTAITAIINPQDGPGGGPPNEDYQKGLRELQNAGVTMLGYVRTNYGKRDINLVLNDVALYADHFATYGVSGIFFDEVLDTNGKIDYYAQLYSAVKATASLNFVAVNPGTNATESYLTRPAADLVIVADLPATEWVTYRADSYLQNYQAARFGAVISAASSDFAAAQTALRAAGERNIGYIYVTDDAEPNPWDSLPSFWSQLLVAIEQSRQEGTVCSSVTELSLSECNALIDLYTQTNGATWLNNTNWGTTSTPCAEPAQGGWYGVNCQNGQVNSLLLQSNGLRGNLPETLGAFSALNTLRLDANELWGQLPSALGQIGTLEKLNLANNRLQGPIPASFAGLTNLQNLYLRGNEITGTLPTYLQNFTKLQKLHLSRNHFTGTFPAAFCTLTTLTELTVASNQLVGEFPDCVTNLQGLQAGSTLTEFGYNALWTDSTAVRAFLDQRDNNWEETQTLPPTDLKSTTISTTTVTISWLPIPYQENTGYYEIRTGTSASGPFTIRGQSSNKKSTSFTITGLQPATEYLVQVRTYSAPLDTIQENELYSEWSPAITVTTKKEAEATPTPSVTPSPSATPVPACGASVGRVATNCVNYLPLVHKPVLPTVLPPTPVPTPQWQQFAKVLPYLDTVAILNGQIHVGSRGETPTDAQRGLYRLASCDLNSSTTLAISRQGIYDLASDGANMLAATRGNRVYYADQRNNWRRTDAAIHEDVFAVAFVPGANLAFAGAEDGLYQSNDAGFGWVPISGSPAPVTELLYVERSDQLLIGTIGHGLWSYRPATERFTERNQGLPQDDSQIIWDITSVGEQLFIATGNGIYRSTSGGNWQAIGLQGNKVVAIATIADKLYAGLENAGLKTTLLSNPTAWQQVSGFPSITVRAIIEDTNGLCATPSSTQRAILVASDEQAADSGLWIYR
ncbi:MAG: fibronectin type III domain-containing protein [Caldilineaceae bacterium]|nr:fibronectin type III domain-containing protein [Caldilineaceae bacterium]